MEYSALTGIRGAASMTFAVETVTAWKHQYPNLDVDAAIAWVQKRADFDNPTAVIGSMLAKGKFARQDPASATGRVSFFQRNTTTTREPDNDYARARLALIAMIYEQRLTPLHVAEHLERSILPHFQHYAGQMTVEIQTARRYGADGDWMTVHDTTTSRSNPPRPPEADPWETNTA